MRQRARKATKRAHTTFGVQANWGGMNVHYDRMVFLRFESFCYVPCYRAASRVDGGARGGDGGLKLRPMAMRVRLGVLAIEATVGT